MSVFRTAFVYVRNDFAGVLKETDEGYSFKYDTDYLQSEKPSVNCTAFVRQYVILNNKWGV